MTPESISGHTSVSKSSTMAALSATGRGRNVLPVIVSRLTSSLQSQKSITIYGPDEKQISLCSACSLTAQNQNSPLLILSKMRWKHDDLDGSTMRGSVADSLRQPYLELHQLLGRRSPL